MPSLHAALPLLTVPHVILLLSDLHLGRGTAAQSRAAERDVLELLRAYEDEIVTKGGTLVLNGDVFHEFIEYRHLVPKVGARLTGLLADWADRGAEILYVVGNRDPWHIDFFETEIGVRVIPASITLDVFGQRVYISHGDEHAYTHRLSLRFESIVRAPWAARMYRMLLPGDSGFALARWASRTFGTDGIPDPVVARDLSAAAHRQLEATDADVVVFGHSHGEALEVTPDGTYINLGYWFGSRTFAQIGVDGPALFRWTDGTAHPVHTPAVAASLPT